MKGEKYPPRCQQEEAMPFVDFAAVKTRVTIEEAAHKLGLELKPSAGKLRCACPVHGGGDRAIVITPEKGLFCCFGSKPMAGGDQIQLVAHIRQIPVKEAAEFLDGTVPQSRNDSPQNKASSTLPTSPPGRKPGFDVDAYASKLDPGAPALSPLGISADTLKAWRAGYSNSGTNRGRLAIALHDRDGNTIGFAGRALGNEQPSITIPNGINPQEIIFGSERVEEGTLYLVRDVLDVLKAHESGVSNCVCFLTEISALQIEMLAALMATKHCNTIELF
jgi:DNA primase